MFKKLHELELCSSFVSCFVVLRFPGNYANQIERFFKDLLLEAAPKISKILPLFKLPAFVHELAIPPTSPRFLPCNLAAWLASLGNQVKSRM